LTREEKAAVFDLAVKLHGQLLPGAAGPRPVPALNPGRETGLRCACGFDGLLWQQTYPAFNESQATNERLVRCSLVILSRFDLVRAEVCPERKEGLM
jgi:hypothetical protein